MWLTRRSDDWFWAMFELTSTWTNFSFGRFSVAKILIIIRRRTERYCFLFQFEGGILVALTSNPGVPKFQERTTSYRADNHMYEKGKINSHQWFICGTQCVKNITVTKWPPEAIWDIRFLAKMLSVRYQWSYNACIKCGNNRPVWYLDLLVLHMYICIITSWWMDELARINYSYNYIWKMHLNLISTSFLALIKDIPWQKLYVNICVVGICRHECVFV